MAIFTVSLLSRLASASRLLGMTMGGRRFHGKWLLDRRRRQVCRQDAFLVLLEKGISPIQQNCHLDRSVAQRRDLRFFFTPPPTPASEMRNPGRFLLSSHTVPKRRRVLHSCWSPTA